MRWEIRAGAVCWLVPEVQASDLEENGQVLLDRCAEQRASLW